ncbi:MAG: Rne/Rng family ribonuclease [Holophagales bacterium]|jgi:ribonuclease G|nr:MAG: Rne/Rng family ribonuclease [Holophagales bacterium]
MAHKMLVESDPYQTRIAVLEDDRLTEIFVERHLQRGVVGNVYKGRVSRVLPGMQAAFVDIGLERDAFLYVSDVIDHLEVFEELEDGASEDVQASAGNGAPHTIDELLKAGQEIIVQATKDPLPNKGARVSTQITLPGRYLVMLPTVRHLGVSRRIEEEAERTRLRELIDELAAKSGAGWIVRTAGEGKGSEEFEADRVYLSGLWKRIRERAERSGAPTLLHQDLDLALRVVRDLVSANYSVIWVDGEDTYERIVDFLDQVQPALVGRVKLDRQAVGLFERFGIESEIEAALKSKVWLKSGGYLVINPTEALVAIDVNTGRFVGRHNLEDTALRTNLEAVEEVVRQIRLRDLGGIIVLDLIDMTEKEHREQVFEALERELRKDRAKYKVLSISEFGLVEITRKRSRTNLERLLTQPCPYCGGGGRVKSVTTLCLALRREALKLRGTLTSRELLLRVHPEVARALQKEEHAVVEELERALAVAILLQGDPKLHHESFDILEV